MLIRKEIFANSLICNHLYKNNLIIKAVKYLLIVTLTVVSLGSCTKDWNCKCKTTLTLGSTNTKTELTVKIKDVKRDEAKTQCKALNVETSSLSSKCHL